MECRLSTISKEEQSKHKSMTRAHKAQHMHKHNQLEHSTSVAQA